MNDLLTDWLTDSETDWEWQRGYLTEWLKLSNFGLDDWLRDENGKAWLSDWLRNWMWQILSEVLTDWVSEWVTDWETTKKKYSVMYLKTEWVTD